MPKAGAPSVNGGGPVVMGDAVPVMPGQCLVGLTDWLEDHAELSASLVTAATALAAGVDARPADAQLWSRYQASLEALGKAADAAQSKWQWEMRDFYLEGNVVMDAEGRRSEKYAAAIEAGNFEEARRWEEMVPIGCTRGEHAWRPWPVRGLEVCKDCHTERALV